MAIRLTDSRQASVSSGIKALVYGPSGGGKTTLCATAYKPVVISAEGGLLSIADYETPTIVVKNEAECYEALNFVRQNNDFATVCLDSISEIAETVLSAMKQDFKDGRKAYGEMNDRMSAIIRAFRDMQGKHVLFTAKETWHKDDVTQVTKYYPSMPGNKLTTDMPYFFDEVLYITKGVDANNQPYHYIQCVGDIRVIAKDRSRKLDPVELPDFTALTAKMLRTT